jgi:hypothetical protein
MNSRIVFRMLFLALIVLLTCCNKKSTSPTAPIQYHLEIDTTIVPSDSLGTVGGPGLYQKLVIWNGEFNPLWGDSVLAALLDSNFALIEFWYPEEPGICADPYIHEREIAKLSQPDTGIYRLGYVAIDSAKVGYCIRYWRHYTILRVNGGA